MMENSITKKCSKCKQDKPHGEFSSDISRGDGFSYLCKMCQSARNKKYYSENIEARRKKNKKYVAENRELLRERARIWSCNHKEQKTSIARNRRAWKKQCEGTITIEEWEDLKIKYKGRCLSCGKSDVKLELDHVNPLSKGGSNVIENAQPLCKSCNSGKRDKFIDYRPSQPEA